VLLALEETKTWLLRFITHSQERVALLPKRMMRGPGRRAGGASVNEQVALLVTSSYGSRAGVLDADRLVCRVRLTRYWRGSTFTRSLAGAPGAVLAIPWGTDAQNASLGKRFWFCAFVCGATRPWSSTQN